MVLSFIILFSCFLGRCKEFVIFLMEKMFNFEGMGERVIYAEIS